MTSPTSKKRILFVDDEPNILAGLRTLLRKERTRWEMVFVEGGELALAEMAKMPFDVIVSDMRMPGMDGATLLRRVRDEHPACARIVLSGHAEHEAMLRALRVAHQFLDKPCDGEILREAIERTCTLQGLVMDDRVRQAVGALDRLPSVPRAYSELQDVASQPGSSLSEVARIIESDPAMSAKVLQLINSAYFGLGRRVSAVPEAVALLGVDLLRGLTLGVQVFGALDGVAIGGLSVELLQRRSLLTARVARRLVASESMKAEAFTVGVLHDTGLMVLALSMPDRYQQVLAHVHSSGGRLQDVEQEQLGLTHAEVGAYLLGMWGLPLAIVEGVAYHHRPQLAAPAQRRLVMAIHAADGLVDGIGAEPTSGVDRLDLPFLEAAGVTNDLPKWRAIAAEESQIS